MGFDIELTPLPKLAVGGIIEGHANPMLYVGESPEATIEIRLKSKAMYRLKRAIQRSIYGSNNWRKRHGLPMYRRV